MEAFFSHSHSPPWNTRDNGYNHGTRHPVKHDLDFPWSASSHPAFSHKVGRDRNQGRMNHSLALSLSLSHSLSSPLIAHSPLLSGPSPLWRSCTQRHHWPRPISQLPWKHQWESVLCVDDRSSRGPEATPALWEAVTAREGQVNLWGSPASALPPQNIIIECGQGLGVLKWLKFWLMEAKKGRDGRMAKKTLGASSFDLFPLWVRKLGHTEGKGHCASVHTAGLGMRQGGTLGPPHHTASLSSAHPSLLLNKEGVFI